MAKLIEKIVIDGQLKDQANKTRGELHQTFKGKRHLFEEKLVTYQEHKEGVAPVTESQSSIQTDVMTELRWFADLWSKAIDTSYAVAEGNMLARASVTLDDGTVLIADAPATAILELEKRCSEFQEVLSAVPTLDPAKGFTPDPDKGARIFKANQVRKPRTQKVPQPIVLYPATTEHPAQTQMVTLDQVVGTILEQEWSGLITPARKADLLARIEEVRRAVKQALQRANAVELPADKTVAKALFDYVLKEG